MDYYKQIKDKILDNEAYERIKDYSKEKHRVLTYFEIGKLLHEAGKHYGEGIIRKYSLSLEREFGKKYNDRSLRRMRQFYLLFCEPKWSPLERNSSNDLYNKANFNQKWSSLSPTTQIVTSSNTYTSYPAFITRLTWTHYIYLITIKNEDERNYYTNTAIINQLSVRELIDRIKSKEYYRLDEKTRNKLINYEKTTAIDYIKNPILIKNNNNYNDISEKILQTLILEDLPSFLKELGNGFSFIGNEYKIKLDDRYNYIDLLLFNVEYNCYVAVELKITEMRKEYIGQIKLYMNYIDKKIKKPNHDKTIGIIICKKNNKFVIEYVSDKRITIREYKIINKNKICIW